MLFNLLLAKITILLFFSFYLLSFLKTFTNPVVIENVRPELAPIIPAGAPIRVSNDAIEILLVTNDKKINDLLKH